MQWNSFVPWMMPYGGYAPFYGSLFALLPLLLIWSLVWKGLALWKAAHEESKPWFVAMLILNTAGILEILYIYVFAKKKGLK